MRNGEFKSELTRRGFIAAGGALAAYAAHGSANAADSGNQPAGADPFLGTRGLPFKAGNPCLQAPGETTMGVSWAVSGLSKGVVEYADNPDMRDAKTVKSGGFGLVPIDVNALQVRLTGLKPATKYWYRTVTTPFTDYSNIYDAKLGEPVVSGVHSFTTLGWSAKAHFCAINDTHANWKPFQMAVRKVKELAPSAVVWNGDATNTTQDKRTAVEIFLNPPVEDRDWSADIPVFFESGNHDFRGSWISKKEEVVLPRDPSERRGDQWDLKWNFAQRLGEMALVGLDTGEDKPDAHPKGEMARGAVRAARDRLGKVQGRVLPYSAVCRTRLRRLSARRRKDRSARLRILVPRVCRTLGADTGKGRSQACRMRT